MKWFTASLSADSTVDRRSVGLVFWSATEDRFFHRAASALKLA